MRNNRMNKNFIKTTDAETAMKLRELNYQELPSVEIGVYTFLNRNEMQFSSDDIDISKLHYTNVLCM